MPRSAWGAHDYVGRAGSHVVVVDSNVVVYLLTPSEHSDAARRAFQRDTEWAAPLVWRSEVRNVLALYVRERYLSLNAAVAVQEEAEQLLAGREYAVDSGAVLALAAQSGRSAYDCEFVAIAQSLGVALVTADRQLLKSFPAAAIALTEFGAP